MCNATNEEVEYLKSVKGHFFGIDFDESAIYTDTTDAWDELSLSWGWGYIYIGLHFMVPSQAEPRQNHIFVLLVKLTEPAEIAELAEPVELAEPAEPAEQAN